MDAVPSRETSVLTTSSPVPLGDLSSLPRSEGALGGAHSPVELRIPSYESIELGYKLREVDPLHFDKHFGRLHRDDAFAVLNHADPEFFGIWSQCAERYLLNHTDNSQDYTTGRGQMPVFDKQTLSAPAGPEGDAVTTKYRRLLRTRNRISECERLVDLQRRDGRSRARAETLAHLLRNETRSRDEIDKELADLDAEYKRGRQESWKK